MLVPISWLKEFVDISLPTEQLAERLSLGGMEVEAIRRQGEWWDSEKIVVGRVLTIKQHPNADRLSIVEVDYGGAEPELVVTGAPNLFQYIGKEIPVLVVPFARAGAKLVDAYSEEKPRPLKALKPSKIRGVASNGMICSERELGLSEEHEGILLLPEDAPIGVPLRDYLGDESLEIGLTPDMARCLSVLGIAREISALTDAPLRLPSGFNDLSGGVQKSPAAEILIENGALCPRYTGVLIKDVQVGPSPAWMQDRLRKSGLNSISNVVDITNYVMQELGQPLHAFDYDILLQRAAKSGKDKPEITIRVARAGEKITTLDDVERDTDESTLLITDSLGPIALAGVMGGAETAIQETTRNIFLETATFEGINNRRTAQRLKLHTDASHRYTRGVPATLNAIASRRAVGLITELAGGVPGSEMIDNYPEAQPQQIAYVTESAIYRQLGVSVSLDDAASALRKLDFAVEILPAGTPLSSDSEKALLGLSVDAGEPVLRCTAPWHRLDIQYPADLIEEIARMIGYESIEPTLLVDALPPQKRNVDLESEQRIRNILVGCGLQETINYSLTTPENHEKLGLVPAAQTNGDSPATENRYIVLANPLSVNRSVMRRSLLVSAMEQMVYNINFTNRLATFELGRVYLPEDGDGVRPKEDLRFSILLTGPRRASSVHPDPTVLENFDFFDLKGILETLLRRLGIAPNDIEYRGQSNAPTFTSNCASLSIKGKQQGVLGELHPKVCSAFGVTDRAVYAAEIRVEPLVRPSWQLNIMAPISNYPPVVEDLAFVVAEEVSSQQVLGAIRAAGGSTLTKVELFDLYRGEPLPAGHKSFAYQLTYQAVDSMLKEKEVTALRNRIVQEVKKAVGGTLRGAAE